MTKNLGTTKLAKDGSRSGVRIGGYFTAECYDKNGNLKWTDKFHNLVTNEGLDGLLDIMFHASTQITTWYCTLVESDTNAAAGMTYAVPTYTESTAYDEATRPEYEEAASSSQSITNSANKATFTISGTKTMYGASIVGGGTSATTKGNTDGGGTLFCYAKFSSSKSVVDDDVINLTYTLGAADDAA